MASLSHTTIVLDHFLRDQSSCCYLTCVFHLFSWPTDIRRVAIWKHWSNDVAYWDHNWLVLCKSPDVHPRIFLNTWLYYLAQNKNCSFTAKPDIMKICKFTHRSVINKAHMGTNYFVWMRALPSYAAKAFSWHKESPIFKAQLYLVGEKPPEYLQEQWTWD